ncbi:MAG: hypothetical protein M3R17_10200 [Bacteroidota bacterium]|nr:hypothetical protein [Bacteroidota bacterium]
MKTFLLSLLLTCSLISSAQDTTAIVKATPVKSAPESSWQSARLAGQKLISDSTYSDSIYGGFLLMVGPRLWHTLEANPELVKLNLGILTLGVPVYNKKGKTTGIEMVTGKITQGKDQYKAVWKHIYTTYDIKNGKVTEMNERDKFFCWQYLAKIEEPIIVILTSKGRLMLQFGSNGKLLFIESTGN